MSSQNHHGDAGQTDIPVSFDTISGAILAGGQSTRMGTDKALLQFNGQPVIERVYRSMAGLFNKTVLVTNHPEQYRFLPCPAVADHFVESGPLAGIHAALTWTTTDWVFVVACDMPLISTVVIRYLCNLADDYDAVVPCSSTGTEPLHALYNRRCLTVIEPMLQQGHRRIAELHEATNTHFVPWEEVARLPGAKQSFQNINTPEAFARLSSACRYVR